MKSWELHDDPLQSLANGRFRAVSVRRPLRVSPVISAADERSDQDAGETTKVSRSRPHNGLSPGNKYRRGHSLYSLRWTTGDESPTTLLTQLGLRCLLSSSPDMCKSGPPINGQAGGYASLRSEHNGSRSLELPK